VPMTISQSGVERSSNPARNGLAAALIQSNGPNAPTE